MGVVGKCCCLGLVLYKVLWLAFTIGPLVLMYFIYTLYLRPWGEDQIKTLSHGLSPSDPALNCSGCVLGINTQFPPNTTGFMHMLDTAGGKTMSSVVAISVGAAAVSGAVSMAWASVIPGAAAIGSLGSNVHEVLAIVEQAQFIGLLGQLQTSGAPVFFQEFTKELAWVNFNIGKGVDAVKNQFHGRQLSIFSAQTSETGVERYASTLGVKPEDLFYYTLMILAIVFAAILALYVLVTAIMTCVKKPKKSLWVEYFRKVIWAFVLILLLSLYIVAMTGSYKASYDLAHGATSAGTIAIVVALAIFGVSVLVGVVVIAANSSELEDLGTYEHEQRPFNAKYGPYYEEFNADNRYFFVPKAVVAVATGVVVGIVADTNWQLGLLIAANLAYLVLLVMREPFLLRFLFYIGVVSVFLKVFLLLLMFILARDDVFPQAVRDNVAYVIVAINILVFGLLVLRQVYLTGHKIVRNCSAKKTDPDARADFNEIESPTRTQPSSRKDADLERGHRPDAGYARPNAAQQPQPPSQPPRRPETTPPGSLRQGQPEALPGSMRNVPGEAGHAPGGGPPTSLRGGPAGSVHSGRGGLDAPLLSGPRSDMRAGPASSGTAHGGMDAPLLSGARGNMRAGPAMSSTSGVPAMGSGRDLVGTSSRAMGAAAAAGAVAVGAAASSSRSKRNQRSPVQADVGRGSLPSKWSGDAYAEAAPGAVVMPEYNLDKELGLKPDVVMPEYNLDKELGLKPDVVMPEYDLDKELKLVVGARASVAESVGSYERSSGYGFSGKMSFESTFSRAMASPPPLLERSSQSTSSDGSRDTSSRLDALAAKYLVEDHSKRPTDSSVVGDLPPKESLAFIPRPLVASKSLGLPEPTEAKAAGRPSRHSHNGVYRRDDADRSDSFVSAVSSDDEIEL
ncbi:hypothetical protein ACHHYP_00345 [Achlya hypogyna]|uniref:TRP C-terminal domain-containing protein n=1 Tax=Achlya hypogyna TaxID=1202772 RepID=A0A1V9ZV67_ACHHY|nr:hypothetical protein ACHHYP_00345 [Achlya hypogyna]